MLKTVILREASGETVTYTKALVKYTFTLQASACERLSFQ